MYKLLTNVLACKCSESCCLVSIQASARRYLLVEKCSVLRYKRQMFKTGGGDETSKQDINTHFDVPQSQTTLNLTCVNFTFKFCIDQFVAETYSSGAETQIYTQSEESRFIFLTFWRNNDLISLTHVTLLEQSSTTSLDDAVLFYLALSTNVLSFS